MSRKLLDKHEKDFFITRVIVEQFPSRVELYQKLDSFISEHNHIKDYTSDNRDNIVHFIFKNPDTAFEFVKFLNMEKLKNPLYSKLRTNIVVDAKKDLMINNRVRKISPAKLNNLTNEKKGSSHDVSMTYENEILNTSINKGNSNKRNKNYNVNINNYHGKNELKNSKERLLEGYDYSNLLPRGKTLICSTPYQTESQRSYEEYKKNKEKWILKKGFEVNFGKLGIEKKSVIPNYVFVTPPKIPLNKHEFRSVAKEKWINKKEFVHRSSKDLVI